MIIPNHRGSSHSGWSYLDIEHGKWASSPELQWSVVVSSWELWLDAADRERNLGEPFFSFPPA